VRNKTKVCCSSSSRFATSVGQVHGEKFLVESEKEPIFVRKLDFDSFGKFMAV
jgi:hypothetical protein